MSTPMGLYMFVVIYSFHKALEDDINTSNEDHTFLIKGMGLSLQFALIEILIFAVSPLLSK